MIVRVKRDTHLKELSHLLNIHEQLLFEANPACSAACILSGETLRIPFTENVKCHISSTFNAPHIRNIIDFYEGQLPLPPSPEFIQKKRAYDYIVLLEDLEKILHAYPFVEKRTIGHSVLGLPVYELKIGNGPKKVHMNGSFHANEWITTSVLMNWLHEYLEAVVDGGSFEGHSAMDLYQQVSLSFVPMVNPDGVQLVLNGLPSNHAHYHSTLHMNNNSLDFDQWKANINGVDLNNQYPANWEIEKERKIPKAPSSRDYPGDAPLTEPESIMMAKLVETENFDMVVAVHTQGEEIYWGYMNCEPEQAGIIVKEFSRQSGYKAIRTIDSHAGFRDWFVLEKKKCGYTIELGTGVNPLPLSQFDDIYKKSRGIFWASLYMLKS